MFLFSVHYKKPLNEIERLLEGHREYLRKNFDSGAFVFCGRKIPRTGGVILCRLDDREEAEKIIREDPFVRESAAEYEIIEFSPTGCARGFEDIMK